MKYKYKQIVISVTAAVMVLGLAVFNTKPTSAGKADEKDLIAAQDDIKENPDENGQEPSPADVTVTTEAAVTVSDSAITVAEETFAPGNNAEVTELVTEYLNAKLDCSEERLKEVVDDMSRIDITEISKRTEKIESYADIQVYTVDGPIEGSYVAVVYEKLKISGIKTPSSGLNFFYIKPAADGKLKICFSDVEEEEADGFNKIISENEDILKLGETVEKNFASEIASDEDLAKYFEELNSVNEETDEEESEDSSEE